MQCDYLSTNEVVARSDVGGHLERALAAIGIEYLGAPGGGATLVAIFGDLEEGASGGCGCVVNLGHIDQDGAVVDAADGLGSAVAIAWLTVHLYGEV